MYGGGFALTCFLNRKERRVLPYQAGSNDPSTRKGSEFKIELTSLVGFQRLSGYEPSKKL